MKMHKILGWLLAKDRAIVSLLCFIRNISVSRIPSVLVYCVQCTVNLCIVVLIIILTPGMHQKDIFCFLFQNKN